ncbi:MAG: MBL fold metallo-hydrolase [Blastocatellia bacterium]
MKTKLTRWLLYGAAFVLLLVLSLLASHRAAPLPMPAAYAGDWPAATPPAGMAIFHLPTGTIPRNAGFGYRGGSFFEKREFAMSAVLVKHPKGDLLIDSGFGREIDTQFAAMPALVRWGAPYQKKTPAVTQLANAGYDGKKLRGIVLTHAHWDHASGLADFPGVPVLLPAAERGFITNGGFVTVLARNLANVQYEEYGFAEKPYLGFPQSRDLYGDGSVVIVAAPGHTPGSVIVFLTLPNGPRYALVGDLVWLREAITMREEKTWMMRTIVDQAPAGVRENLLRMSALAMRFPDMIIVPAHDARAYEGIPQL